MLGVIEEHSCIGSLWYLQIIGNQGSPPRCIGVSPRTVGLEEVGESGHAEVRGHDHGWINLG